MSAVPKNLFFTHVHKKWLQMYGKNKNLYITYNSVRNININNDTPKKEKKIQVILYIQYYTESQKKKKKKKSYCKLKLTKL